MEAPEFPDWASGAMVRLTLPPAPPSALTLAMESPPAMAPMERLSRLPPLAEKRTSPALPELALARSPPAPPLPPIAVPRTVLTAAPVFPDLATADELAPLLASDCEAPTAVASPVGPELPVLPVCVPESAGCAAWAAAVVGGDGGAVVVVDAASAAVGDRSRMAAAATLVAPAKQAAPATRTLLLPLVMLIPCLGSAFEQVPDRGRTSPHDTK